MSVAHLSFILYSRIYLVGELVTTVRRLIVTDTNIYVMLSCKVCHSMALSSSLKTLNQFKLFSLFQQIPRSKSGTKLIWERVIGVYLCLAIGCAYWPTDLIHQTCAQLYPLIVSSLSFSVTSNGPCTSWTELEIYSSCFWMGIYYLWIDTKFRIL